MAARLATAADLPSEFDDVDSREIDYALRVAALSVSVEAYDNDTSEQHALLASHILKRLGLGTNKATAVTSTKIKVASVERSSSASFTAADDLNLTEYGKRFQAFGMAVFPGPMAI